MRILPAMPATPEPELPEETDAELEVGDGPAAVACGTSKELNTRVVPGEVGGSGDLTSDGRTGAGLVGPLAMGDTNPEDALTLSDEVETSILE
jgi:hypothetical protein